MAEFNFYGTVTDWEVLLELVFSHAELCVIPDVFYPTPKATFHRRDSRAFREAFEAKRGLFIKGRFTSNDAVLRPVGDLGYCVDEVTLGPLIDLFLPRNEGSASGILLRPGWLAHQSKFWLKDRSASFSPSLELKRAFRSLVTEFKQRLVRTEISSRVWVGEHALQQLRAGRAMILENGKWWRFRNGVPRLDKGRGVDDRG